MGAWGGKGSIGRMFLCAGMQLRDGLHPLLLVTDATLTQDLRDSKIGHITDQFSSLALLYVRGDNQRMLKQWDCDECPLACRRLQ